MGIVQLSNIGDSMSSNENFNDDDFEKIFSEIVSSEDLQDISQSCEPKIEIGLKELLLIQQSIIDSLSHIHEIVLSTIEGEDLLKNPEGEPAELLSALYKISEDFNECIQDQFVEFAIIEDEEIDDDMNNVVEDYEDEEDE